MIVICKLHKQFFIDEVTISLFYLPLWFLNSLTRGKNNPRSQNFSFVRDALNDTPASMSDFLYSLSTYQLVIFKASHSLLKAFSRFQFLEWNQMLSHGSLSPYELVPVCLSCLLWATSLHSLYFRPIGFHQPSNGQGLSWPTTFPELVIHLGTSPTHCFLLYGNSSFLFYQFSQLLRVHSFMSLYPTLLHVYFVYHCIANDIPFLLN